MNDKLRVAAYARVSTDKDDQANSLENQKTYFASFISNHEDWIFVNVYYDEGISGTQTKNRTGFNKMIDDAKNGNIDLIITKEVSRFARNTVDTLSYTRELKEFNVGVIFTLDNIDTRQSDGEFRLTIMASIAQEESRKTSERVKWGQKRQMEKGVVFGRDLLGYTVKNGEIKINEDEVPIVKAIFNKFTNEGKGTTVIARELLEEGMKPKRIGLWSATVILRALRNEKYVGDLAQKKTYTPNYLTHSKKYNRGAEDIVYIKNHHEPIIDRDLWNRTQKELNRRTPSKEQKLKYSNRYWCSGKIFCAECGSRYVSRTKKLQNGNQYKAWRCYAAANHGARKQDAYGKFIGCDNSSINDRSLKTCMNYCINLIQNDSNSIKKEILNEISKLEQEDNIKYDTTKLKNKIINLETKKKKAIDAMLDGFISKEDLKEQTEWYNNELESLNNKLTEYQSIENKTLKTANKMTKYIDALNEITDIDMDANADKELIYKEILDHIDIHKGNILDIWLKNIPFGIQLEIKATGKQKFFKTEILKALFVQR